MSAQLPKDVHPDSLSRLPLVSREELDAQGKRVYDALLDPKARTIAGLQGPGGIWLHSPKSAQAQQDLNRLVRYENGFGDRITELAILTTARETDQQFEWTVHEPVALKAGLEPEIIDLIKYRKATDGLPDKERVIVDFIRQLLREKKVASALYAAAQQALGRTGLVTLVGLVGVYVMTGIALNAVDQQLRPGTTPLLPLDKG